MSRPRTDVVTRYFIRDRTLAWKDDGACREEDPDTFFPRGTLPKARRTLALYNAKKICGRCPVLDTCRDYAIRTRQRHGVWGGTNFEDPEERKAVGG